MAKMKETINSLIASVKNILKLYPGGKESIPEGTSLEEGAGLGVASDIKPSVIVLLFVFLKTVQPRIELPIFSVNDPLSWIFRAD